MKRQLNWQRRKRAAGLCEKCGGKKDRQDRGNCLRGRLKDSKRYRAKKNPVQP